MTIDGQTVNFVAAAFRIVAAEAVVGVPKVDVGQWKGSTAPDMTGDAYARLGSPAGASVSSDLAAVKTDTGNIRTRTDGLPAIVYP